MKEVFSKEQNKKKYLNKSGQDLIDIWAGINKKLAISFCIQNIHKMSKRYISGADKAHNPADIQKALDYANRALMIRENLEIKSLIILLHKKAIKYNKIEKICLKILKSLFPKRKKKSNVQINKNVR